MIRERGITVIDADQTAREVTAPGSEGLAQIARKFGSEVITPEQTLDRRALGRVVFADAEKRQWLEGLLHPLIRERMDRQADAIVGAWCVLEIPLLVETGRYRDMAVNIVVHCPLSIRVARLRKHRDMEQADIDRIVASQASDEERLRIADHVIDSSGSLEELPEQVDSLIETLNRQFAG